jgi:hypothetical protein
MQIVEQEFNIVQEFPAGSQEPVRGAGRSKELPQVRRLSINLPWDLARLFCVRFWVRILAKSLQPRSAEVL